MDQSFEKAATAASFQEARTIDGLVAAASGALIIYRMVFGKSPFRWTSVFAGSALLYYGFVRSRFGSSKPQVEAPASSV